MTNEKSSLHRKALYFAVAAHSGQKYGDKPYHYHLTQVDRMVKQCYADHPKLEELRAIACLHDVIEDTPVTPEDLLNEGFNLEVVDAVVLLSKDDETLYETYISQISQDELARIVKLCDTSCNLMNSVHEGRLKNINKYTKQIQLLGGFY